MAINCAAAERGGLIEKEKKRKESSWVKLKTFPSTRLTSGVLMMYLAYSLVCYM